MNDVMDDGAIIKLLRKISAALKANDEPSIYEVIDSVGAEIIFSEKSIGLSRAMRDVRLVVFLLFVANENNFPGKKNKHWMTIYKSINSGVYNCKNLNDATSRILKSIIDKKIISIEDLQGVKFEGCDESDLELAIDFRKWSFVHAILDGLPTTGAGFYSWLNSVKMIVDRQKFIVNTADGKEFSRIYKLIINKLNGIESIKGSLNAVKLLYGNSLQISGDFESALKIYAELSDVNNNVTLMMEKARCHSKMGKYSDSIQQLDSLISMLIDAELNGEESPILLQTPADLNYTKSNAISAYSDIAALAEIAKAELFMVSGTLLGYCRVSDFLPNDKDLDFGLIGLNRLPALVDLALKSGLFHISPEYLKGIDTIQVPFIHVPTGVWIDVFIYHNMGEKFMTGVDFQFGYRQTFEFSKFKPIQVNFHNLKTYIPSNFDENLRENFSSWKDPDVNYISHVESPSIMDYGGVSHQMTSRFWLIRSIQSKSLKKINKVIAVLKDISGFPLGISGEIFNKINLLKIDFK